MARQKFWRILPFLASFELNRNETARPVKGRAQFLADVRATIAIQV